MRAGPGCILVAGILSLIPFLSLPGAPESPHFQATTISFDGDVPDHWTAEMNGDSLQDLVVARWSRERGREILIYLQQEGGSFPGEPDRRIPVKKDIVAFSIADVRTEPGSELLLFTASSCFSYSTAKSGYAGNVARLFQEPFLWDVPGPREVAFLPGAADIDGDGSPEILVPGREGFALFGKAHPGQPPGRENEGYELRARFPLKVQESRKRDNSGRIILPMGNQPRERPFSDLVLLEEDRSRGGDQLLKINRSLTAPLFAEANGDGRLDLFYFQEKGEEEGIQLFLQNRDGSFPVKRSWRGWVSNSGPIRPVDLDGDGMVDLLVRKQENSKEGNLTFYRNRGGSFSVTQPDQVMKFSGFIAAESAIDLDGDGRRELVVSTYEISKTGALIGGRVDRRLFIHSPKTGNAEPGNPEGRLFRTRPASAFEEQFGPDAIRGISQSVILEGDLPGRGSRDALLVNRNGTLEGREIGRDFQIAREPFWRFVPPRTIIKLRVSDLNGDGRSDILLGHSRSLTLLVSRRSRP